MTQPAHLRSLQALELAIRTGSLKAAADELNITPAAVGQRIKLLEDSLGVGLLVRGRSGLQPAPGLVAALPHLAAAFREIDTAARLLDYQRIHELHIAADIDWADLWLLPRLAGFRAEHPNIRFCVNGVGDVPMRLGEADCEVWFGPPRGGAHEVTLFRDYLLPVSGMGVTPRVQARPRAECLEGYPLLHLECYDGDPEAIGWPEWLERYGGRRTAPGRGIRYRKVTTALEAVISDAGFMVCGLAMVEPAIAERRVSLPFPAREGAWSGHAYQVRFRDSFVRRAQGEQFRDWLVREGAATEEHLCRRIAND